MMSRDIIIYNTEDGKAQISLKLEDGTVWLNQAEIAKLFQMSKQNVSKHIIAIFEDGELEEEVTVNYKLTVQNEGSRQVERRVSLEEIKCIEAIAKSTAKNKRREDE
ncbi:hypothetical protein [Treponema phagedenis]|uniref:hypothetical protein n=1 Tax=Treponema phagedenis TaxID=162 RepID=UPI001C06A966|nr:hypothetical protein [Treponema phagedenis]